jgi:hypothetical protein
LNEFNEIRQDFLNLINDLKKYIESYKKLVLSSFDENRIKSVQDSILRLIEIKNFDHVPKNKIIWNQHCLKMKYDCEIISMFSNEPLSIFPDVNLWLFNGDQAIGLSAIKARNIIWSNLKDERGSLSGKIIYTDIKVCKYKFYIFFNFFEIVLSLSIPMMEMICYHKMLLEYRYVFG